MSTTSINVTGKTVTVAGSGFRHEVEVNEGETIADALDRSGVNASGLGVDLLVGGARRDASQVTYDEVSDGSTLAAPAKSPAHGIN